MCELLISVVDKGDAQHWVKRGTVVETFEDGHSYGDEERTNLMFRIIQLPGTPLAWGRAFMGPEFVQPDATGSHGLARLYRLDIDHPSLPANLATYLADNSRGQAAYRVNTATLPLAALAALKVRRDTTSPNVIGDPGHVIG